MSNATKTVLRAVTALASVLALLHIVAVIDSRPSVAWITIDLLITLLGNGATAGILNSNFVTSIVGALAGAFFGAWGAQKIATRAKRRDDLLNEIRNTNAAIAVAFAVADLSLSLKKQHVKPLKDIFDRQQLAFAIHGVRRMLGVNAPLEILFDLRTITPVTFPLAILQNQVFEKLSVSGRPLALMATLSHSVETLDSSLRNRNELVAEFERRNERNNAALLPEYLGLREPQGKINEKYPDFVRAIFATTDDVIFFSLLLGKDLVAHGDKLAKTFEHEFGKGAPGVSRLMHWRQGVSELIPDDSGYSTWLDGFVSSAKIARIS